MQKLLKLKDYISEFKQIIDQIYGTYLDSTHGFHMIRKEKKKDQDDIIKRHKEWQESNQEYKNIPLSGSYYGYGRLQKQGQRMHLHQATFEEIMFRNSPDGRNFILIANLCIVSIYQYWEDHYRKLIAQCLGSNKDNIQVPLFADINFLRRSIIHNFGIAVHEADRCEILKWFKKLEPIQITRDMFEQLIDEILDCLDKMEANPNQFIVA